MRSQKDQTKNLHYPGGFRTTAYVGVLCIALIVLLLTGCGSSAKSETQVRTLRTNEMQGSVPPPQVDESGIQAIQVNVEALLSNSTVHTVPFDRVYFLDPPNPGKTGALDAPGKEVLTQVGQLLVLKLLEDQRILTVSVGPNDVILQFTAGTDVDSLVSEVQTTAKEVYAK